MALARPCGFVGEPTAQLGPAGVVHAGVSGPLHTCTVPHPRVSRNEGAKVRLGFSRGGALCGWGVMPGGARKHQHASRVAYCVVGMCSLPFRVCVFVSQTVFCRVASLSGSLYLSPVYVSMFLCLYVGWWFSSPMVLCQSVVWSCCFDCLVESLLARPLPRFGIRF